MNLPDALVKGAIGVACAGAMTLCGMVLSTNREVSVHADQIVTLQQNKQITDQTLKDLNTNVQQLHEDVAVLNERLRDGAR